MNEEMENRQGNEGKAPNIPGAVWMMAIAIALIDENPDNPRKDFDLAELAALGKSLRKGQKDPIRVMRQPNGRFMLIAGHRRLRAARMEGLETLQAIVVEAEMDADEVVEDQLVEQLHREDYNPMDRAEALQRLLVKFDCTGAELAERLDLPESLISKSLTISEGCSDYVKELLRQGKLGFSLAYLLARVDDAAVQKEWADEVVVKNRKRAWVEAKVKAYLGTKPKDKVKVLKGKLDGRVVSISLSASDTTELLAEWFKGVITKLLKHKDLPPDALGFLFS